MRLSALLPNLRSHRSLRAGTFAFTAAGLLALACGSDSDQEAVRKARISDGCLINSDCNNPLVCAFRRCHNACESTRDCAAPQRCVASDKPFYVCQLADEVECSYNSQCPATQVCGVDGKCRDQCSADRDCLPTQLCRTATCAEPAELVDGGLPSKPNVDAGSGLPCSY